MCLIVICISSLVDCMFESFAYFFFIRLSSYCILRILYVFCIEVLYRYVIYKYIFSKSVSCLFQSFNRVFEKILNLIKYYIYQLVFLWIIGFGVIEFITLSTCKVIKMSCVFSQL